ncbi:hypothetical protein [Flavobacterium pectinovorum]|uniref:Uncharacterized protein n=1 Tax=Flavobacterium pectinovorum TaxID=29533 RepID=A0AB36P5Q7_9FLAO|nr:hypothetical protein [Flavobacterium pectinovorum]OXB06225.1 hypothetical protein B0A72_09545 [Flavobacterium pectinovorum]SHM98540.1 hypothetical protein SAMN05444387_3686 [Flavobacterium pectinovorum]
MKRKDIKVNNSSDYWYDYEAELSVYGFLRWEKQESLDFFLNAKNSFAWDYICLSNKFGIATSTKYFENIHHFESEFLLYKSMFDDIRYHNPLLFIHTYDESWVFPSILFINNEQQQPEPIVSIDPIIRLEELNSKYTCTPIKVALDIGTKGIQLYYYLDNDIFNLRLENKKCLEFEYPIDNSDLAYLNTQRLNSFLRDLKKLCFKYGANDFEFENLGLNDFSENGVLFDGEVIYYEDIVGLLLPHQKIVK